MDHGKGDWGTLTGLGASDTTQCVNDLPVRLDMTVFEICKPKFLYVLCPLGRISGVYSY